MLLGAALMAVGHAGAWILALALARRLTTGERGGDLLGAFVLHALIVTLAVLLAGSLGLLNAWMLFSLGAGAGIGGIALGGARAAIDVKRGAIEHLRATWRQSAPLTGIAVALGAAIAARHAWNVWVYVPSSLDEGDYHLPKLATWMQTGGLFRPDLLDLRQYFPAGQQLIQAWWVGFLHHDGLIEGANVEFAAMAAAGAWVLSRRMGLSPPAALLAASLFSAAPAVMLHATSAMNDLAAGAMILAMLGLAAGAPKRVAGLALAGTALLVGTGIKPIVAFALPGPALLAWLDRRQQREAEGTVGRPALVGLLALSAFAGGYWYLINLFEFGNPVYPVGIEKESSQIGMLDHTIRAQPGPLRMIESGAAIFGTRLVGSLGPTATVPMKSETAWGWALTLLGLPATVWALVRSRSTRRMTAACALSVAAILLMVEYDEFNARFVMWAAAVPAAGIAWVTALSVRAWPAAVLALAGSTVDVWSYATPVPFRGAEGERLRTAPFAARDMWLFVHGGTDAAQRAGLESAEPVLCIAHNYAVYSLARGDYRRQVHHTGLSDPGAILKLMDELGCRWLVMWNAEPWAQAGADLVNAGHLRLVTRGWLERAVPK